LILAGCDAALGASPQPSLTQGERLAQRHCATCHALTAGAPSPLADAPAFPQLRARYSTGDMATILHQRMTQIHRRMPLLEMGPDEVNAFLGYWEAIAPAGRPGAGRKVPPASPVEVGRTIVVRDCGGCHATGITGQSAFPDAPPFRTLGARYDLDGLAEALAEGISVGHPAMPERAYPAHEVDAIIAYLKSVQPNAARAAKPLNAGTQS
jgi:mono/diheme cytochrome c family protein